MIKTRRYYLKVLLKNKCSNAAHQALWSDIIHPSSWSVSVCLFSLKIKTGENLAGTVTDGRKL